MTIIVAKKDDILNFAHIALDNALFEDAEWGLYAELHRITRYSLPKYIYKHAIALFFHNEEPVGICLFSLTGFCSVHTYIKPEYRKKGYGTQLFIGLYRSLSQYRKTKVTMTVGTLESYLFFQKLLKEHIITKRQIIYNENFDSKVEKLREIASTYKKDSTTFLPIWISRREIINIEV